MENIKIRPEVARKVKKAINAITSDPLLIALHKSLDRLFTSAMPKISLTKDGVVCSYDDKFWESIDNIHKSIQHRRYNILSSYDINQNDISQYMFEMETNSIL